MIEEESEWVWGSDGGVRFKDRLVVSNDEELREKILQEAYHYRFAMHPGGNKMYQDLKRQFWWHGINVDVGKFITRCFTYQQVKVEHQSPAGLLQPRLVL